MSAANVSLALPMSSWTVGRKVAAAVFSVGALVVLTGAAVYLSAVLFLVLNKADPRQARFDSIGRYWTLYADDAQLRKKLLASMAFSGIGLLVVLPSALYAASRPQRPLHGDARFANRSEVAQAGLLGGSTGPGILVGRYRGRFLQLPGQLSVMLSAPTRSGKGVGVVVPNLLNWPDSVVVLDIKGENFDITAGYRAACGQAVYAFSPFDESARSHRWNPLSAVRTSALHRVGDLLAIGQVFFPNDGSGTSSEAFFNDQARNLFMGLGLLLLETPELPRTIGEVLRQSSGQGQSLKAHLTGLIEARKTEGSPLSDECTDALQRLLSNSENTLSSIVSTLTAPLTIFADAVVDGATSTDDFRLEDVRRRRMSIYVRIPPNRLASARPLLNLFFSQLVSLNTQHLPEQDPSLRYQCLLVNDEFAAMGRVSIISSAAAFLAGYNLRLLTVVQAMSQLDAVYGDKEARTFATNHGLQILYAPREQRDADEYSAMLGQFTERATSSGRSRSFGHHGNRSVSSNESGQRRALLLPQEFKELGSERLVVIVENCKPILAEKIRYHREKEFRERLRTAPVVPQIDMDLHLAVVQRRWRFAEELASTESLSVEALAYDMAMLPDVFEASPERIAETLLDFFGDVDASAIGNAGGSIEAAADEDGVLMADLTNTALQPAHVVEIRRHRRTAMRSTLLLLAPLLTLGSCGSPTKLPTVDESTKRPANSAMAVDLQVCQGDLQKVHLQAAESQRAAEQATAALAQVSTRQQLLAAIQTASTRSASAAAAANSVFTIRFDFGSAKVNVSSVDAAPLLAAVRAAPLVVLRGRTDGMADTAAESHVARSRALAVRDYLVAAGIDPGRLRVSYQPSGDQVADNTTPAGRALNRRVEIEAYAALPASMPVTTAALP